MPLVVIGLSHHSSTVAVRERFAFSEASIPTALQKLCESGAADEAVILSTCNRVEIYAATRPRGGCRFECFQGVFGLLPWGKQSSPRRNLQPLGASEPPPSLQSGFRPRFHGARGNRNPRPVEEGLRLGASEGLHRQPPNKAFQRAFNVAKQIRTETNIQRGSVSVGSAAVELAEKIFSDLGDRDVLVIGAGDTSEKTARALLSRGARGIVVTNRSHDKAVALAAELGGPRPALRRVGQRIRRPSTSSSAAPRRPITSWTAPSSSRS